MVVMVAVVVAAAVIAVAVVMTVAVAHNVLLVQAIDLRASVVLRTSHVLTTKNAMANQRATIVRHVLKNVSVLTKVTKATAIVVLGVMMRVRRVVTAIQITVRAIFTAPLNHRTNQILTVIHAKAIVSLAKVSMQIVAAMITVALTKMALKAIKVINHVTTLTVTAVSVMASVLTALKKMTGLVTNLLPKRPNALASFVVMTALASHVRS